MMTTTTFLETFVMTLHVCIGYMPVNQIFSKNIYYTSFHSDHRSGVIANFFTVRSIGFLQNLRLQKSSTKLGQVDIRGPWWSWIAQQRWFRDNQLLHQIKFFSSQNSYPCALWIFTRTFLSFICISLYKNNWPRDGSTIYPGAIIWIIFVERPLVDATQKHLRSGARRFFI